MSTWTGRPCIEPTATDFFRHDPLRASGCRLIKRPGHTVDKARLADASSPTRQI